MGERGVLPQTQLNIKIYQRAQLIRWHFLCSNPFRAGCFFLNLSVTETKTGTKAQQSNHKFLAFCDKRRNFAFWANFYRMYPDFCKRWVMPLATLKLLSSKNSDYGAAERYLLFEHDEFTNKPVLDESGRLIPRENCRFVTLNCGDDDFAIACMKSNLQYDKNRSRGNVKSHHYIISFDPRDGIENGLTVDRAQELGEQFCREHFAGHQAIVCTHADGHNHSGNIHCHIFISSLQIEDVRSCISTPANNYCFPDL